MHIWVIFKNVGLEYLIEALNPNRKSATRGPTYYCWVIWNRSFIFLRKRKDIVIKAADKGGALVVWRTDLYQKEALRQHSDTSFYQKVDKDLTSINQNTVKNTINELIAQQELPASAKNLIITTPRTSCIYFLPKIHKPNNPGRPIVSACSCPTELISSYSDKFMAPIVKTVTIMYQRQPTRPSNFSGL